MKADVEAGHLKSLNLGAMVREAILLLLIFLQKAIEAYRRIGNTKEIVDKIHSKLLDYEQKSISEMQQFSTEFDVSEYLG